MTYEKMMEVLSASDSVKFYGAVNGKSYYAKVSCTDGEVEQDDFPEGCTASDGTHFVVSLLGAFDSEDDMCEAMQYCEMYTGQ
jgi:hypothetical protein